MLKKLRHRFLHGSNQSSSSRTKSLRRQSRPLRMETLEDRHLLTGGLTLGADQTISVSAGAPLQIPINAVDTNAGAVVSFSASPSSGSAITGTLPTGNPDWQLTIAHTSSGQVGDSSFSGTMTIELYQNLVSNTVAQIVNLTNQGKYDGTSFYRIASNFVIQGGLRSPPSTIPQIDDEFNSLLRYTSDGVVGLARQNAHDTGSSEFFISANGSSQEESLLDFKYAIFGRIVSDPNNLRAQIQSIQALQSDHSTPITPVTITSAKIITDPNPNDLALIISAPPGTASGTQGDVTVTATDGKGGAATQTFHVTIQADLIDPPPFFQTVTPPTTKVDTQVSFQLPAFNLHGDPLTYYNQAGLQTTYQITPPASTPPLSSNLNVSVNSSTGLVTVTPSNGLVGVQPLFFGVFSSAATSPNGPAQEVDTQLVPFLINPAAPISISLDPISDTGANNSDGITSLNNSDASHTLKFDVSGVTPGDTVVVFGNGFRLGAAVATSTSVVVTTDGKHKLTDGPQSITAKQIAADQNFKIGNTTGSFTPTSQLTAPIKLTIDATGPSITTIPVKAVQVGQPYSYAVNATDSLSIAYSLLTFPTGMSVNSTSGVVAWTPTAAQVGANQAHLRATDLAGNSVDQTFTVTASIAPPFTSIPVTAAQVAQHYNYTAVATGAAGLVYSLNSGPTGMTINPTSGIVTWTPTLSQVGSQPVDIRVTDTANNMTDQTFTVAVSVGPAVIGVSAPVTANATFHAGGSVPITLTFTSVVNVVTTGGTPQLTLNDGAMANYSSGTGTATLTFNYTVASGENASPLDYASTSALALNGGTIKDNSGNAASLTLPATGTDGLAAKNITVTTVSADLAVTITPSSTTMVPTGAIAYTITITNNGPTDASGVTLSDTLPVGLSFGVQTQASGPAFTLSNTGNAISDTIATLAHGASATLTVVADVGLTAAAGTVISNTTTVASTSPDPNLQNNSATASSTVIMTGVMLTTDSLDATKNELVVSATSGNDNVSFLPAAGGMVLVNMDGKISGPFAVSGRIVAYGQAGNNVISVSPAITLPAFLFAGSGSDELIGGGGNNVLVGGGGADVLIGGPGRNVLIAGAGPSKLYSSRLGVPVSSNSGSIMVGGTTDFDHNDTALAAIMQEWGSSDAYATRVSKIRTGQIALGVALNLTTVHQPTRVVDQLFASAAGYDWFLAPSVTDQIFGIDPHKKGLIQIN